MIWSPFCGLTLPENHAYEGELRFRTYKVARRYDSDIAAVCGGFALWVDGQGQISEARLGFGGGGSHPKTRPPWRKIP